MVGSILDSASRESKIAAAGVGSAWLQFGAALVFSFFRYRLLFAYVPQQDLGLSIMLTTALSVLFIFDTTMSPGVTTEVGRSWNETLPGEVISSLRYVYKRAFLLFVVVSVVAIPVVLFFAKDFRSYWLVVALWGMFSARAALGFFAGAKSHVLTGIGKYYVGKTAQLAGEATGVLILFVGLRSGLSLIAVGIAAVAEGLMIWNVAAWFFAKYVNGNVVEHPNPEIVSRLKATSLATLGSTIGLLLTFNTDNFFLARYIGLGIVANYSIAYRLAFMIPTFCNPFYNAIYPRFVNALQDSDRQGVRKFFSMIRLNHFLATALALGIIFLGKRVIDLWVGPGHYIGMTVLGIFVAMFVFDNISYPQAYTLLTKNKTRILMYMSLASGLLNLGLTFYLAPRYGAVGVAGGTFIAQLATHNLLLPFLSVRNLNYGAWEYFRLTVLPVACIWLIFAAIWIVR